MTETRRKPTRRDLIVVVTRLQGYISAAIMHEQNENTDPGPIT